MTDAWTPFFVLPNIPLQVAIGCDFAALAPAHDPRVASIKWAHPTFRRFLNRFSDAFGKKFEPAVLIVNDAAPSAFHSVEALASFRDLIALSTITFGRASELLQPQGHRVVFGEAFAIYPWTLDRNYGDLIASTPAMLGAHELGKFKGQSSPALFRTRLEETDIDQPLLIALLERWQRHYEAASPVWADVALMRSLNMAYNASLLPAGTDSTIFDVGRIVALWISAFEILVHPEDSGQANLDKVFETIERTAWLVSESGALNHETGGKKKTNRTLAAWIYQRLYDCRNDFLHGNPVDLDNLILPIPQRSLFEFAAPLYRLALTAFLPLTYNRPMPATCDPTALGAWIAGRRTFRDPQKRAERAILMALKPPVHSLSLQGGLVC